MAYDNDQNEFPISPDGENEKRTSLSHLPRYFRTPPNKKFLTSTIDQLIQPGVVEKLNAYYGRKDAKAFPKYLIFGILPCIPSGQNLSAFKKSDLFS